MEILLWLAPAALATTVAMVWVAWWGREGRGEVDRETAARRLGEALSREQRRRPGYAAPPRPEDRSSGVALRPSKLRPVVLPPVAKDDAQAGGPVADQPQEQPGGQASPDRRAS
ncbi:hypothetical protein L615_002300000550 [Nocardioides sp. J9]|uniref:hypothetical protein n=1 Tax=unclassified Nocardioides TaxID=2615069 RepID=UPI0004BBDC17|nr:MULTISPECIES: hypothetical protein [unclassified Nocardioides]TWH00018.1 hypothetical protein L615_002300000550 [Nocardioides sp. J9]